MTTVHAVNADVVRNLRAVLAAYGLPQKTLVTWCNVQEGQISKLMAGDQEWRLKHLAAIANRVHVDLGTLLGPKKDLLDALPDELPNEPRVPDPRDQGEKFPFLTHQIPPDGAGREVTQRYHNVMDLAA